MMRIFFRTILNVAICVLVFNSGAAFSSVVLASAGGAAGALSADTMNKLSEQLNSGHEETAQQANAITE